MKQIKAQVNIIGGGLVGAITAFCLSKLDMNITLLEKKSRVTSFVRYNDQRTLAISEGTRNFLEKIGIWKKIKIYAEPIKKINIIDRKPINNLDFDNRRRDSFLGYIIKNKDLINVVYKSLKKQKNVHQFFDIDITNIQNIYDHVITKTNKISILSDVNIAADGKYSSVREKLKTPIYKKNYNKKALVLTLLHSKNHNGTAFEFFYKDGPLAILPMKSTNINFSSSIVWTNQNNYVDSLLKLDNEELISILEKKTNSSLGIVKLLSKQNFPISAHLSTKFYDGKTIYIGDAAHSFHPIAGQGWNLGMKDVENIFNLIKKYNSLGINLGNNNFCKEYHNENYFNAYRLYQITDKLDNLFRSQNTIFNIGRSVGLSIIQRNSKIKNLISDFAMGVN